MIYLDNAGTTRVLGEAAELMTRFYREDYYNPSALYAVAGGVRQSLAEARERVAARLCAAPEEIVFTSCATESNNWALRCGLKNKKGNFVISAGEHPSVYETAQAMKSAGSELRVAPLTKNGGVDSDALTSLVDENTCLVSLIHCSNETGVINDLSALTKRVKSVNPRAVIHSDGVQAFCKTSNDVNELGVDLYSVSAHKIGGAKGTGALYVRRGLNLAPFLTGGGQEKGRRSGTENTAGIVGFGRAVELFPAALPPERAAALWQIMADAAAEAGGVVNGKEHNSGYILSVSFEGLKAEVLQHLLSDAGVIVGTGSACSARLTGNRVLAETGLSKKAIAGSIRISFGPDNTTEEIERAAQILMETVPKLRGALR